MRLFFRLAGVVALSMLTLGRADAAYTVTFNQVGNNVVATGIGSLNITGLNTDITAGAFTKPSIQANVGLVAFGTPAGTTNTNVFDAYRPYGFGPITYGGQGGSNYFVADTRTGDAVQIGVPDLYVPAGYKSNNALSSTMTFLNTNYANLALKVGTYSTTYSAGYGQPMLDTVTIQINPATSVPEPSTLILLGSGLVLMRCVARQRS